MSDTNNSLPKTYSHLVANNAILVTSIVRIIKELALEYDKECKEYPESPFEGEAFYQFVCERLAVPCEDLERTHPEIYGKS